LTTAASAARFEKTGTQRQADLAKRVAGYMSPLAE
jgi:hypothetical protein